MSTLAAQTLQDGNRNLIVKLTGVMDVTNFSATLAIDVSTYSPAPTEVRIDRIEWSMTDAVECQLYWDATTDVLITTLSDVGVHEFKDIGGLINNAGAGKTGDIMISSTGAAASTFVTITLWMVKSGTQ